MLLLYPGELVILNPPSQMLWPLFSESITQIYKITTKNKALKTQRAATRIFKDVPVYFEFISEYAFFLMFTFVCMAIKIIIRVHWLPISGLVWWYQFFHGIIYYPGGRSLQKIFKEPDPIAIISNLSQEKHQQLETSYKRLLMLLLR